MAANKREFVIPRELVTALNQARTPCQFWNTPRGCRRGAKCPRVHNDYGDTVRLPHENRTEDGLTINPPLDDAWKLFFREAAEAKTIGGGFMWCASHPGGVKDRV